MKDLRNTFYGFMVIVFGVCVLSFQSQSQEGVNRYRLNECTGIDANGDLFEGANCKDKVVDGPCDRESICYENETVQ